MSTLTKILIVLLTLSSIFLCGIVVTYVGNADSYRQKYEDLKADRDSLSKKVNHLTEQVNDEVKQRGQVEEKLNSEVAALNVEISELESNIENVEREKAALLQKVTSWTSLVEDFTKTNQNQGSLLQNTLDELDKLRSEEIKNRKELNETTSALVEKMAIIESLEAETKRLFEEKSELQSRLDQTLQPYGKTSAAPVAVTPKISTVQAAMPMSSDIGLQGLVTGVDLKNSMVSISVGKADGVKEGMKFHVTRGDDFLCDVLIIDADSDEAVGVLDLVQQQPQIGDNVSTNL